MNKIYKVIWSKAKNCYVVASELAKSHTKAPKSGVMSRALVAGVLACVLNCGAVLPAYAEDVTLSNQTLNVTGDYSGSSIISSNTGAASTLKISNGIFVNAATGAPVGASLPINFVFPTIASVGWDNWVDLVANTLGFYENGVFVPANPAYYYTTLHSNPKDDSASSIIYQSDSAANAHYFSAFKDPLTGEVYTFMVNGSNGYSAATVTLTKTDNGYWTFSRIQSGSGCQLNVTSNSSSADYTVLGVTEPIDKLTVNSSTLSATGDINVGSISSSSSTISASNIKTTSGDINASTSDITATESVESAGVVKAKSLNAPRLLGAGSGMSTLGGGLTVAGQVKGVTAGTADTDAVNVAQLNSAIAGASTPYVGVNGTSGLPNENGSGASGSNSIAIGTSASASTDLAIALGASTSVLALDSTAIGYQAKVNNGATNSVALGGGSETTEANTVSVGNSTTRRRIVNVADGTNDHDVVTVGQVKRNISGLSVSGKTITYTKVDGTTGTITTQDTDTHYTSHLYVGSGTASNEATTNGNTKIALYDDSTAREAITIKGGGKTTVASDANGVITIFSTDANTTYSAGNGVSLSGTTFSAKPYNGITVDSNGIGVKAGTNVTVNSNGVSVTGSGSVASGNTGLISGGTLFTEGRITADGTFAKKANSIATNITALDTASKNAIKGLSVSGTTITYTKGDGSTGTITTQDTNTTYSAFTGATSSAAGTAGLVKAPAAGDQNKFLRGDGTWATDNNTTYSAGTGLSLSGTTFSVNTNGSVASGNAGVLSGGTVYSEVRPTADGTFAKKANTTAANITALDTAAKNAIKGLSINGKVITYTKGDGTTGTITTQDTNTTYSSFTGATSTAAGTAGLVKAPAAGDQNKFLRGDGTWAVDNDTTYTNMSASELSTGTATTARSISAKTIADYVTDKVSTETTARNTAISSEATARVDADTALGSRIDESIKGLSVNGKTITYTKGDGTTGTITTQDTNTTYAAGNGVALSGTTFSAKAGTNVTVNSSGINVVGNGSVASGNTGLVSGGTLFTENRITADGTFAKKANTTAANITALDTAAKNAIKGLSVSGQTITYTKGDGTTGTITTQDNNTTYDNMSATELSTGTATTARSISAKTIADYVTGKVSVETTARTSAVSSEATTRANADTALGTRIDNAITAYESADTGLSNRIGSLSADGNYIKKSATNNVSANLTALDTQLKTVTTAVSTETTNRTNADTALGNRIGTLSADGNYIKKSDTKNVFENLSLLDAQVKANATAVSNEVTNRTNAISSEASARSTADTALGTRIDNVTSAYQSADTGLSNRIGSVSSDGTFIKKSATNDVATNLTALDTAAKNAIKGLSVSGQTITYTKGDGTTGTITTQDNNTTYDNMTATELSAGTATTARSISAKTIADYVTGKVSAETTARTTAINSEATTRANADTALGTRIDNAITAYESADTGLSNRIGSLSADGNYIKKSATNNVSANLTALDTQLKTTATAVSTETTNRTNADTALSNRIGSVASDGTFIKKSATNDVAANLTALDTAAKNAIKTLSVNGTTITYTKGDGTTGTITTQDTNTTYGAGTADNLTTGTDTTGKVWTSKVLADYVKGQVATETTNRTTAVSNEATARSEADTALSNRIGSLIADGNYIKKSSTNNVSANLTALDTQLKTTTTSVSTEATTRANADTALGTRIDNAVSAYESADTELSNRIGTVSTNGNYIKASSAKNMAENLGLLDTAVKANATAISNEVTNRTTAVTNEATARTNADTALGTRIDNVTSAYQSADTGLSNRIGTLTADGHYIKKSSTKDIAENLQILDEQLSTISSTSSSNVNILTEADAELSNRIGSLASDGNYIKKSSTNDVIANLSALDTQLKITDTAALKYDGSNHELATLGGTNGTKLTNLKQGTLSVSSTDAVTGAQLYATNQSIAGFATDITRNKNNIRDLNSSVSSALDAVSSASTLVDTINGLKADASLNNLTAAGRQVIATAAANAVQEYMANNSNSLNMSMSPLSVGRGLSSSGTLNVTDAGNGSLHVGEGSYVNGTSSIAIGVGNQVNANNSGAFGDPSIINADESYVLGNDDTINEGATGSFLVGNDSVSDAKGGLSLGSNNKLESSAEDSVLLGNNTSASGRNSVALGSGSVAEQDDAISVGNSTLKRRIMNVADGDVSEGSTDVVTGGQLYVTNEKVKTNEEAIAKKAETDASNIDVEKWSEVLGTGEIAEGNTGLVNGGTVYEAMNGVANAVLNTSLVKTDGENIFVGSEMGGSVISVMNNEGESRVITGVATNPQDPSSAANVGYVNAVGELIASNISQSVGKVNNRIDKVGANAAALASLTPASFEGSEKWSIAASVGHFKGETAGAVGAFYKPAENVMMNVRGSFGNDESMLGAGVAIALDKGDVKGVTKRQLADAVNKQAKVIDTMKQEREEDRARIVQLEAAVQALLKEKNSDSSK